MDTKYRILMVDDSATVLQMLEATLSDAGYETIEANDGFQALEVLKGNKVDLILLDFVMPKMDGLELCRTLKGDPRYRSIPIVMLTALSQREYRIDGIEAGADDYMIKPFDRKELLARIRSLLKVKDLNMRVEKAYDNITSFISYTEISLKKFNPVEYRVSEAINGMADRFVRKGPADMDKPSHLLIVSDGAGLLYNYSNGNLEWKPVGRISFPPGVGEGDGFICNEGGLVPEPIRTPLSKVIERIGGVNNLVIAGSEGFKVVAFNYPRKVNRMDVQVMMGFIIHNQFFKSLSEASLLIEENPDVRRFASDILGFIGDRRGVSPLIEALDDPNPNVRSSAANSLGMIGDRRGMKPLIDRLEAENEEWVIFSVIEALGKIGDEGGYWASDPIPGRGERASHGRFHRGNEEVLGQKRRAGLHKALVTR